MISFDHTFKVAANIGYPRADGKWIPQYDSLFIVMNEDGLILTWLTRGTTYAEVVYLLENLKCRSETIRVVYVDDCCKHRTKIHSVFGQDVSVKLHLFHATQRITRTLQKSNDKFHNCVQDLRLVFWEEGDSGKKKHYDAAYGCIRKPVETCQ